MHTKVNATQTSYERTANSCQSRLIRVSCAFSCRAFTFHTRLPSNLQLACIVGSSLSKQATISVESASKCFLPASFHHSRLKRVIFTLGIAGCSSTCTDKRSTDHGSGPGYHTICICPDHEYSMMYYTKRRLKHTQTTSQPSSEFRSPS